MNYPIDHPFSPNYQTKLPTPKPHGTPPKPRRGAIGTGGTGRAPTPPVRQ